MDHLDRNIFLRTTNHPHKCQRTEVQNLIHPEPETKIKIEINPKMQQIQIQVFLNTLLNILQLKRKLTSTSH